MLLALIHNGNSLVLAAGKTVVIGQMSSGGTYNCHCTQRNSEFFFWHILPVLPSLNRSLFTCGGAMTVSVADPCWRQRCQLAGYLAQSKHDPLPLLNSTVNRGIEES